MRTKNWHSLHMLKIADVMSGKLMPENIGLDEIVSADTKPYAVFTSTGDDHQSYLNFLFYLPLTALAWKRIDFGSIVVLVGSADRLFRDDVIGLVVSRLRQLGAIVIFLETKPEHSVLISQVC